MAVDVRLVLDQAAIDDLEDDDDVEDLLEDIGDDIADRAREGAPVLTGAGARSIHAELDVDAQGPFVAVGWSPEQFYLRFAEEGTVRQRAQPFLRPAFEATRI
ncbi:HK97-gp10 family putative phage morphogenesis protein [Pseudokineococcus marinus]|uniref:Uncharacterized protein n=1 Tax=Pseudokineococcus marinus TaxID=351215 RepID=A0A849BGE7_9ACTN|nr:HK97-gp10 family putative phage morphogenesis protein [Pseudokineococcus marinus]NNH21641.1 hypothetical protein [Pseudokineococcus marinus]